MRETFEVFISINFYNIHSRKEYSGAKPQIHRILLISVGTRTNWRIDRLQSLEMSCNPTLPRVCQPRLTQFSVSTYITAKVAI